MEPIFEKGPQSIEDIKKGKIALIRKKFDVPLMVKTLKIHEQKIYAASKEHGKLLGKKEFFNEEQSINPRIVEILATLRTTKTALGDKQIRTLYIEFTTDNYKTSGTRSECLFIRYVRRHVVTLPAK
jgi:hypothetical protein